MRGIVISTLLLCLFLAPPKRPGGFIASRYSGTVVAVTFDKDRVIVAADSRELQGSDPPFDKACKIVPLSNQVFFASLGFQSGAGDKTNTRITFGSDFAHEAFNQFRSSPNTGSRTEKVAERWGALMRRQIQDYVDHHPNFPDLGQDAAYGVFGSTSGGEFFIYTESIYYPDPPRPLPNLHPQVWTDDVPQRLTGKEEETEALGLASQEVSEFLDGKTQRAVAANVKFNNAVRDAIQNGEKPDVLAMKMKFAIEIAERWDQIDIGGDVDVLEIERNGSLRWIYVKKECKTLKH
jgi:hypothetical protein